jgi:hypothetical protein
MDNRIRELLAQISALDAELRAALHARQSSPIFRLHGRRIQFDSDVSAHHQKLKRNFFYWLVADRPQNLLTGPFIYALAIPLVLLDLVVTVYQAACFPIYQIAKVRRREYIVFDRHKLGFLNFMERFHCEYCAYATGLLAYVTEISARTEQYFCPIKHAHKILGTHQRYDRFIDFGESTDFHARLEQFRQALANEQTPTTSGSACKTEPDPR